MRFFEIFFYFLKFFLKFLFIFNFFNLIFFLSKSQYGMTAEHVQRNVYIFEDVKFSFQKRNK